MSYKEIIIEFFRRDFRSLRKHWFYAIIFALLYGIEAYLLHEEILASHGDYRPLIFIPPLVSIAFGSLVGAVVGGLGNLINDIITKYLVEGKSLHMGHAVGFIANFLGAYVVGLLAKDIRSEQYKSILSKEAIKDYIWNTLAGSLGMGAVTGLIIGLGLWQIGKVPYELGIRIAGSIMFWNSLFMVLLFVTLPLYAIGERWYLKKMEIEKAILTSIQVVRRPEAKIADIEKGEVTEGKPIEREWFIASLRIRNLTDKTLRFRVEIIGPDIIQPSVKYTKKLAPGEYDDITFSIYPLDSGERHFRVRVLPWSESVDKVKDVIQEIPETLFELKYKARPETSASLNTITSFLGILALLALLFKGFLDLMSGGPVTGLTVALAFFAAEVVLIIIWYIWRKYQLSSAIRAR